MLDVILNGKVAKVLMLHLQSQGEIYATGVAKEADQTLSAVQKQIARFESAGLLLCRKVGKTRLYRFNPENPYVAPLRTMAELSLADLSVKAPAGSPDEELWRY